MELDQKTAVIEKDKMQNLQLALKKATENVGFVCRLIKQPGKPSYHPGYMIQHGMDVFRGNKSTNELVANFNSSKTWDDVLLNYIKCPP